MESRLVLYWAVRNELEVGTCTFYMFLMLGTGQKLVRMCSDLELFKIDSWD